MAGKRTVISEILIECCHSIIAPCVFILQAGKKNHYIVKRMVPTMGHFDRIMKTAAILDS